MNGQTVILRVENARDRMAHAWALACRLLEVGKSVRVTLEELQPKRSLEQNAKMWAVLTDIAHQVQWPVDGKMQYLAPEDWKDILSAGLRKSQRVAAGVEGGFVMLGQRTSRMRVGEMVELIELAHAFGAERGVVWGDERREAA
jgi:hypothetical protein